VVFLSWIGLVKDPVERQNLKYMFQLRINNKDINMVLERILKDEGVKSGKLDTTHEVRLGPRSKGWNALLATPNMNGVCWLLVQHRKVLGPKTIKGIRVFLQDVLGEYQPRWLSEIGDQYDTADVKGQQLAKWLEHPETAEKTAFAMSVISRSRGMRCRRAVQIIQA
jgi:hypothetical protein